MKQAILFLVIWIILTIQNVNTQTLTISPIIGSYMVLQHGYRNKLYGTSTSSLPVRLTISRQGQKVKEYTTTPQNGQWEFIIDSFGPGGTYSFKFQQSSRTITFDNILFGDVYLCSGQSNMAWPINKSANSTKEIEDAKNYPNIRFFNVALTKSQTPLSTVKGSWKVASPTSVPTFSAVCYFFGREIAKRTQKRIPIGLIGSSWSGTEIELWSPPQVLRACNTEHPEGSFIFNGMIHPLKKVAIKAALWYQGESNARQPELYKCLQPAMIQEWRKIFNLQFHFYFVQLAGFQDDHFDFREIRWAQTWALKLPGTGMATAVDLGEPNDIHPQNKQDVGRRLELIAASKIYGFNVPFEGPTFGELNWRQIDNSIEITVTFNNAEGLIFKNVQFCRVCCQQSPFQAFVNGHWRDANIFEISSRTVLLRFHDLNVRPDSIRYAWYHFPECILYDTRSGLPATPFILHL